MTPNNAYAGWKIEIEMDNPLADGMVGPVYDTATQRDFETAVWQSVEQAFPGAELDLLVRWDAPTWSRRIRARSPEDRGSAERDTERRVLEILEKMVEQRRGRAA